MNRDEAKEILLLYRPGTDDADEPQTAQALALAGRDAELSGWLKQHLAQQNRIRAKFRQITPPDGLKQLIISEHAAEQRARANRRTLVFAAVALVLLCAGIFAFWPANAGNSLVDYRGRMVRVALTGYAMDLETNDMEQVRSFLARQGAPADYHLPPGLQKVTLTGCAVEKWNNQNVAMVCFRRSQPNAPGEKSDLWLFVIDRSALSGALDMKSPEFAKVKRLSTAMWVEEDKIYLLGLEGDEQAIRSYL